MGGGGKRKKSKIREGSHHIGPNGPFRFYSKFSRRLLKSLTREFEKNLFHVFKALVWLLCGL